MNAQIESLVVGDVFADKGGIADGDADFAYSKGGDIEIEDSQWEAVDYLSDRAVVPSQLHTSMRINGCPMHFEAYLLDENGDFCDSRHQQAIVAMKKALHDDEQWQTITLGDHCYVVIALPFGRMV